MHVQSKEIDERMHTLSKVALHLLEDDVSFTSITSKIDALSDEKHQLELANNQLSFIEKELVSSLASVSHDLQLILKWKDILESEMASAESVASLERKRKVLIQKARELNKELERTITESKGEPPVTITQLLKQKEKVAKKEEELKIKKAKLKVFQGLPPNLELARHALFQAQQEQMRLFQLRERLLGSMADNIS